MKYTYYILSLLFFALLSGCSKDESSLAKAVLAAHRP